MMAGSSQTHCHAAPSPDGKITMEERIAVQTGFGIRLHFGTDHDHIADYRPLVDALGLNGVIQSIVASEISPVLRGHFNAYPLTPDPTPLNNGAYAWWLTPVPDTPTMFDNVYDRVGDFCPQSQSSLQLWHG